MRKRSMMIFINMIGMIFMLASVYGQTPPTHSRLLYEASLNNDKHDKLNITNINGSFISSGGWGGKNASSRLHIVFPDYLPPEGTVEFKVKNFDPVAQGYKADDKYNIASLDSRGADFYEAYGESDATSTSGSWSSFQVGREDAAIPSGRGLQLFSGYKGYMTLVRNDYSFNNAWDPNKVYTFKLVWNREYAWLVVNGTVLSPNPFSSDQHGGQIETFLYLDLGNRTGLVDGGLPGPIFYDLKVFTNDANYIFSDVSFSQGVYGGVNKKGDQGAALVEALKPDSLDIYIANAGDYDAEPFQTLPNRFYHYNGTRFTEKAAAVGLSMPEHVKYQAVFFDMDNDKDYDVFVARNYYDNSVKVAGMNNLLFRNNNGQFVDATPASMAATRKITQSAAALDIDNDGDVDLVGMNRYSDHETYLNDGAGNFTLVSRGIGGAENTGDYCQGIAAGDVNNDGFEDIVIVKEKGSQDLFVNNPANPGYFKNEASTRGFIANVFAKSAFIADFNNDGALDIFVTAIGDGKSAPLLQVFQNNGSGNFINRTAELNITSESLNVLLADFNNDGYQDIFMAASNKEFRKNRFKLHINNKSGGFIQATTSGLEFLGDNARGTATGDFNHDGKMDLFVVCRYNHNYFLRNETENGFNYLKCKLLSSKGMVGGLGAKVYVYQAGHAGEPGYLIGMRHACSANGYVGQSSPVLHFGVGSHQTVDVRVNWPGSNPVTLTNVAVNQTLELGGTPGSMKIISGNQQTGSLGRPLPAPFVVGVNDGGGNPLKNAPVTFIVKTGAGKLSNNQPVLTNDQGLASTTLTLGSLQTNNSVDAESPGLLGSPLTFTATAGNGFPTELQIAKGANQTSMVGLTVSDSVTTRLMGDNGQPVPNYPVRFQVTTGNGTVNSGNTDVEVITDAYGLARVAWKLGTTAGTQTIQASARWNEAPVRNSPLSVNATATSGPATRVKYYSGNNQSGAVGQPLAAPFCVQLLDNYSNPVAGYSVQYVVTAGGGNFYGSNTRVIISDANGQACASLTLGPNMGNNNNTSEARASGLLGSPVAFVASASISRPDTMFIVSGDKQSGKVGQALKDSLVVVVKDSFGNLVPGVEVTFTVTAGNGNLTGASVKTTHTNNQGRATALLTLGPQAGQDNNKVAVTTSALPQVTLYFTASAVPANATKISKISGDEQVGAAGAILPAPLIVKVTDPLDNPVLGQPVNFAIQGAEGSLEGSNNQTRLTDAGGLARVSVTLGGTPGTMTVHATSTADGQALSGSPVVFNLHIQAGQADSLLIWSGNYQTGFVNSPLRDSIRVKVVDAHGYPVADHQVIFTVKQGGGNFDGQSFRIVNSNRQGIAPALPTLGPDTGANNNIFQAQANGVTTPLKGSPVDFIISAKASAATQIQLADGNNQVGVVGQILNKPLKVLVLGAEFQAVANHPVLFSVTGGNGVLDGTLAAVEKRTNAQGYAEVAFKLGTMAGIHKVEASATDGVNPLQGSAVLFSETALVGPPDANESLIMATSPIPADGVSKSELMVFIYDVFKNPILGKTVLLNATGSGNTLIQPTGPTDTRGMVKGYLASTTAEIKTVTAVVIDNSLTLARTATVKFTAGRANTISYVSGNAQIGHISSSAPEPLTARVTDILGNGIQGYPVEFVITSGSGRLVAPQPIFTDSLGAARAHLILGPTPGTTVRIEARATPLTGSPVVFLCTALVLQPADMVKIAGDNQNGWAGAALSESLVVRVMAEKSASMWGVPVHFAVTRGTGLMAPAVAYTDEQGYAWSRFTLGTTPGLNEAQAHINDLDKKIVFQATGAIGSPAVLEIVSGDGQTGVVNSPLTTPLKVRLTDLAHNPTPGAQVLFAAENGGSVLTPPQPMVTDTRGEASAWVSLGDTTGSYRFRVKALGTAIPEVIFQINALPGPAYKIIMISGNNQIGKPFTILPQSLVVKIKDEFGNAVPGIDITFLASTGGGKIIEKQPLKSGPDGTASAQWQLGREPVQSCIARSDGLEGSPMVFTAYLQSNRAPEIKVAADTTIMEDQQLEFYVYATDAEGDAISFGVRNLPPGASFDSTASRRFFWKPGYDQEGTYTVTFIATDVWGGSDNRTTTIRILNKNRPPAIVMYSPAPLQLPLQAYYVQMELCVTAVDPDQDALFYRWAINGIQFPAYGSCFTVVPNPSWPSQSVIDVWISDGSDSVSLQWSIPTGSTSVNLSLFRASYLPFKGIQVHWETAMENGNAGFNLLRSEREDGSYQQINLALLAAEWDRGYDFIDADVRSGKTYFYLLQDVAANGRITDHGPIRVAVELPYHYELAQNYPNPFNPTTTIQLTLPQAGHVTLAIYNITGQQVRSLIDQNLPPGFHQIVWDGKDENQQALVSGLYYYVLQAGSFRQVRKLLLLK